MKHTLRKQMKKMAVILFWLIVWQTAAVCIDNRILLVGPAEALNALVKHVIQPDFMVIMFHSFARIGLGFFLALFAGLILGMVSYRFPMAQELLSPVIQTLKSIPVASFVVLLLIWFGSQRLSFFISFLIVFPNVYVNMIAGLKSADVKLLEMAKVFGIGRIKRFFYIYRPAFMPYLESCLKISLGMSWKSGVAAEVIGLPEHSLGERLYLSKIYLDTAGLFAWTFTIIFISFFFEKTVLWLIKRAADWKPYPKAGTAIRRTPAENDRKKLWTAKKDICVETDGRDNIRQRDTIRVCNLYKSYPPLPVLEDYSMSMRKGGRYLLMAPSGSGKTTLLRILTGLEHADRGEVCGMTKRVGMVFQEDRLCEEYDAVCNIMLGMGRRIQTDSGAEKQKDAVRREASRILPEECLTKPVSELSGGMRRRVALLRAVLSSADMLILDEPFAGLDEENRLNCAHYLLDRLNGRTLLVTSHREDDVELLKGIRLNSDF